MELAFKTQNHFSRGRGRINRGRSKRGRDNHNVEDRHTREHSRQSQKSEYSQNQRGRGKKWIEKSRIQYYYCKKYGQYESKCRNK
jgi:hypothetical protein